MESKLYKEYKKAMQIMNDRPSFDALKDEVIELIEDKSLEEVFDVIHTILRMAGAPTMMSYVLGYPTAIKHAKRVAEYGCPRSRRNHLKHGDDCICKR